MQRILAVLLSAALLAACGSSGDDSLDWSGTDDPTGAGAGVVWADRETGEVHLSDGSTLEADREIGTVVIAGAGAYVVGEDDDELIEVTTDGVRATGAHITRGPKASPDGRHLAFIDPEASAESSGDTRLLTTVVVDLQTGEEVFRSTRGMGDPDEDDLAVLYENAEYSVLGLTNETAWIKPAAGDVFAIDLGTAGVTAIPDDEVLDDGNPWSPPAQLSPSAIGGPANSDRSWGIYNVSAEAAEISSDPAFSLDRDELESADGSRLVPRTGIQSWNFEHWLDDTTVVGFGRDDFDTVEEYDDTDTNRTLLTCTVPDGACTLVPDSQHAIIPAPNY